MAEKVFDGFTASLDLLLPPAEHLGFVGQKDPFKPFDTVDPRQADLLAGCSGPDHPLNIDDPSAVEQRPERLIFAILRSLTDAVQGELIRIIQKSLSAGPAGWPIKSAIEVSEPVDLLVEVIDRIEKPESQTSPS